MAEAKAHSSITFWSAAINKDSTSCTQIHSNGIMLYVCEHLHHGKHEHSAKYDAANLQSQKLHTLHQTITTQSPHPYAMICCFYVMLCCAGVCYIWLRCATLCYTMLLHAMLGHGMSCCAIYCHALRSDAMPCHPMLKSASTHSTVIPPTPA